jgi:hypothetical protein
MQMQKVKAAVSLVIIFTSVAFLAFRFFGPLPKIDARAHVGIGNVLAEQAVSALGSGGRITLIAPDTSVYRHPGAEVQLKAFHRAIRKANLTVAATNSIKLDPLRLIRVSAEDFVNLLRKQSEGDVVVSLLGPPTPTAEQRAKLPVKHARVVAVCSGDMPRQINLPMLFEENLLYAAIVSRTTPALSPPQTDDPQAWCEHLYQVITARNSSELSSPAHVP